MDINAIQHVGRKIAFYLATMTIFTCPAYAQGTTSATISIQANEPGTVISPTLFGIFFEEINFGGDGGIYAEMVRNRSFQESASPDYWTLVTDGSANGTMAVDYAAPLNTNIVSSLQLTRTAGSGNIGVANGGYWGMSVESGAVYDLSLYAKDDGIFSGAISARLESSDGSVVYDEVSVGSPTTDWQKFSISLTPDTTDTNARLVVSMADAGTVWLSMVSLFPQNTYLGRENGLRLDLANKLAALEPTFYRFPGGNFIESLTVSNAVRWKKSIGPIEERPGHLNDAWGYWSTDGYGLDEFFRQCEDMGMEPLYDINAGLMLGYNGDPSNTVALDELGPWVQDALDLIEYANGDTNTVWGAVRAVNGHPAPYNLRYLEIGNENGGAFYDERYAVFYDAIKAEYPEIHLIASGGNWPGGPPWSRPVEIVDEHYYNTPSEMISFANKYDSYDRNGSKVFVGEYATLNWGDHSGDGSLQYALGEAAFMTGMERNSDIVVMAAFAPMFGRVGHTQWDPNLIYYDNNRSYGTPSYYVQQLFSCNSGDYVLPTTIDVSTSTSNPPPHGAVGVGTWNTAAEYDDIMVTSNGVILYTNDFSSGATGWNVYNGAWGVGGGAYQQTDIATDCRSTTGDTGWADYTISLRASKLSGSEGFLILFNWQDDDNFTWLNLGGWNNSQHAIQQEVNGSMTVLSSSPGSINTGQWYDIDIVIEGHNVQCYLDGSPVLNATYSSAASVGLYASTSFDETAGEVVVKAVNPYDTPLDTTFELSGVGTVDANATMILLTSGSALDKNSLVAPTLVSPVTNTISNAGNNFTVNLPANSLSVLRLAASGIDHFSDLLFGVPSVVTNGELVATTLWGWQSGGWVDLTPDPYHAITYASGNPGVALVDSSGNITGISSGTSGIVATYGALGLSATQVVQVVTAPSTLAHRYSFSEASGANVADSIGGPAWDGTLPNGGSFGSGELTLAASGQEYVNLPGNILSNYAAVTIESWVSFPSNLPNNCFYFGFGDMNGSEGIDYIFCAPQAGRIAITDSNYSGEKNTYSGVDFSYEANLHLTAVFNPPGGYIALYTNGVLAGINSSVAIPLSSVNNVYSFIGRSLYSADPYPDMILDEFRIYKGALTPGEVAATEVLGPDQLLSTNAPSISASASASGMVLSWPLASAGYIVQSRTNLVEGAWLDSFLQPQLHGDQWEISLPPAEDSVFFRLMR